MSKSIWTAVNFGKFKQREMTLPQILLTDPDWFFYMFDKNWFPSELEHEAADIAAKARKIRVPGKSPKRWKVQYYFSREGSFERLEVVRASINHSYPSSGVVEIAPFLDLSITRKRKAYDKQGGKRLIKDLKFQLFGRTNVRLTKHRCETFFEDPRNFG